VSDADAWMEKVRGWAASHPQAGDPVLTDGEYLERLEEEVKLLPEREKLLRDVVSAVLEAWDMLTHDECYCREDDRVEETLDALAAYDARKGTDEVPKVR